MKKLLLYFLLLSHGVIATAGSIYECYPAFLARIGSFAQYLQTPRTIMESEAYLELEKPLTQAVSCNQNTQMVDFLKSHYDAYVLYNNFWEMKAWITDNKDALEFATTIKEDLTKLNKARNCLEKILATDFKKK